MKQQKTDYDKVADANNLMKSGRKCMSNVTWKFSTQNFYLDRINRVRIAKKDWNRWTECQMVLLCLR